jgi:16S rRNA (uracil1498-N3)-methyltransferase
MATAGDRAGSGPPRAYARPLPPSGPVTLDAEESAHLVRSRRAVAGDEVVLFDGEGATALGRLVWPDARAAVVEVVGPYPDREPEEAVRLAIALPEAGRADAMLAALAELGVTEVRPLSTERAHPDRLDMPVRRGERWARILRESAKVSGRSRLLALGPPLALADALGGAAGDVLLLDLDPTLPGLLDRLPAAGALPLLLVGPEGGFSPAERARALAEGVPRASLAATVLRTETAALAAAATALAHLRRAGNPPPEGV